MRKIFLTAFIVILIDQALKVFIKTNGLENSLSQQKAIDIWKEVVGEAVSKNTETISVEHGLLIVKSANSVWRQELQLQKKHIIKNINNKLKKNIIKDIRFL